MCHYIVDIRFLNVTIFFVILSYLITLGPCSFKRRELATSLETRTRFPELVVQEEKRVRFVVVNGLAIVEKPSAITIEDMEWYVLTLVLLHLLDCNFY